MGLLLTFTVGNDVSLVTNTFSK